MKIRCILIGLLALGSLPIRAQERATLTDGLTYSLSAEVTASDGDHTPLWLNANKYGLSSLEKNNGYLRAGVFRPLAVDSARKFGLGYGADIALAYHFTSRAVVQQAFVEGRWLKGTLTIGSKEQPVELKNQLLSTGAQTLGGGSQVSVVVVQVFGNICCHLVVVYNE